MINPSESRSITSSDPLRFDLGGVGRGGPRLTVNIHENADIRQNFLHLDAFCEDGTVEEFYLSHSLEHIPSQEYAQFLKDLRRKVRPGGTVRVIQTDVKRSLELYSRGELSFRAVRTVIFPPADRLRRNPYNQHFNMWGAEELEAEFRAAGFASTGSFEAGAWRLDTTDELHPGAVEAFHHVMIPNLGVWASHSPDAGKGMRPIENLDGFEKKIYSQNGEDGITLRLLELLGCRSGFYLEIGTESGVECNTRILRERPGFSGVMLDGGFENPAMNLHREFVTAENILEVCGRYKVPSEIALLSIDIDGNDYWIWKAMAPRIAAEIVIIEYNAALGPGEQRVMPYNPNHRWDGTDYYGASISALTGLGKELGYSLVYADANGVNLFFVRNESLARAGLAFLHQNDPAKLFRPPRFGPNANGHSAAARQVPLAETGFPIPRIIHQTWQPTGISHDFPPQWAASWREMNPGWEYRFWSEDDVDRFVCGEFPDFYPLFRSYDADIKRVEAFRYLLLKRTGGICANLDFMCLKPLDALLTGQHLLFGSQFENDGAHSAEQVGDAFMASVPGHPFWDGITVDLARHASRETRHATGSGYLTARIQEGLAFLDPGLYPAIAELALLYPLPPDDEFTLEARTMSRQELAARFPEAFGVAFRTVS